MSDYRIEFTPLASAFATAKCGGTLAVAAQVRQEIDELLEDMGSVKSLCFHTVWMDEDGDLSFICTPTKAGNIRVDTATYEDGPTLDAGPLAGKTISIPTGDSDN